ncbi:hypothetical protein AGMMS50229_19350 [Campylobacterota bacterium]|nr:hypothetical protein AGMMS50229_19350 [Campylobacterota bacterium]
MKKIILIAAFVSALLAATPDEGEARQVDTKIEAIKEQRVSDVPSFKNPFYYPPVEVVEGGVVVVVQTPTEPKLESVVGKKAMINGAWKKEGETVFGGWKIDQITSDSVFLSKGNTKRTLILKSGVSHDYLTKAGKQ